MPGRSSLPQWTSASFCPVQFYVPALRRLSFEEECPVLGVMVRVEDGEYGMLHVSTLLATVVGDVEKIEFHCLPVRRQLAHHARPVSYVTIMRQEQPIPVQVHHGDRIFRAISSHLMHY